MRALSPPPMVGIGMPVYNGERFVAEAIESILRQSLKDFELVICDNASTDRTQELCTAFAASDGRIRYFRNDVNLGAHPNFNKAFTLARGRYFKWATYDDVLGPNLLRNCVDALEQQPDAAVCQSDIEYIDGSGDSLGVHQGQVPGSESAYAATRFAAMVLRPHDCYAMMGVFRRETLEKSILLPSFHGADRALLAQVALHGRFISVPGAHIQVRDHGDRYSRTQKRPQDRAAWHDTRNVGKFSFPVWRLYRSYWHVLSGAPLPRRDRVKAQTALFRWWFKNFNSARMAVDLVGSVAPGIVEFAERIKQSVFSPAPGVGEVRRSQKR